MKIAFIILFCITGITHAAPPKIVPNGTTRIQNGIGGSTNYYGPRGYIGRSQNNLGGGQTYFNKSGYTGRTDRTYNGFRYTGKK